MFLLYKDKRATLKKENLFYKTHPSLLKSSDALKLFGFLYKHEEVDLFYDSQYNNRTKKYH